MSFEDEETESEEKYMKMESKRTNMESEDLFNENKKAVLQQFNLSELNGNYEDFRATCSRHFMI